MDSYTLTAIPLFVLMADVLQGSGLGLRVYGGLSQLVRKVQNEMDEIIRQFAERQPGNGVPAPKKPPASKPPTSKPPTTKRA